MIKEPKDAQRRLAILVSTPVAGHPGEVDLRAHSVQGREVAVNEPAGVEIG